MKGIACTISFGKTAINYQLLLLNRKSMEIAVHPDKRVVIKAPQSSCIAAIEAKIRKRVRWIKRQIAYFNQFDPRTPERKYVGGESHRYLGRKYRLKIQKSLRDNVLLQNGCFYIECINERPTHIKDLLETWYKQKAHLYLSKVFDDCWESFNKEGIERPSLKVQKMAKRWGSLSSKGRLTLNLRLIQAPRECIEYVITHELCHLIHPNHSSDFYKLLRRTMPDWIQRKHKLERSLV